MDNKAMLLRAVEETFNHALAAPSPARWKSCSVVAGCAAVRFAADGEIYLAAQMEGVADDACRKMLAMMREVEA